MKRVKVELKRSQALFTEKADKDLLQKASQPGKMRSHDLSLQHVGIM